MLAASPADLQAVLLDLKTYYLALNEADYRTAFGFLIGADPFASWSARQVGKSYSDIQVTRVESMANGHAVVTIDYLGSTTKSGRTFCAALTIYREIQPGHAHYLLHPVHVVAQRACSAAESLASLTPIS